ncbi:MAG: DUF3793 family protein [Clostridia bacterium]|nr:DUF3793 family protein [Clostridia bacterium]
MSEETIIRYCAPTLASIKTGSLFSCRFESDAAMRESIRALNRRLSGKGLRVMPLRYGDGRGLIYVYRPGRLRSDLQDGHACRLLCEHGYCCENANRCVARLRERIRQSGDFPHEIGLFLGYPPEDVDGFINRKAEAKFCGCWKVYGDVDSARKEFAKYKKCTDIYLKKHAGGTDIEKLAVAG